MYVCFATNESRSRNGESNNSVGTTLSLSLSFSVLVPVASVRLSSLLHGTRQSHPFPHNIVTAFRGGYTQSLDSFAGACFIFFCFFFSLVRPLYLPVPFCSPRFSFSPLYPRCSPRATISPGRASGVTPVIRDGPDEAFIILSEDPFSPDNTPL